MKQIFLLIFTIILILSCNNGSASKETQSDKMAEEEKIEFEKIQNMSTDEVKTLGLLRNMGKSVNLTIFQNLIPNLKI